MLLMGNGAIDGSGRGGPSHLLRILGGEVEGAHCGGFRSSGGGVESARGADSKLGRLRDRSAARLLLRLDVLFLGLIPELARPVEVHLEQAEVRHVRQLAEDLVELMLVRGLHLLHVTLGVAQVSRNGR